MKDLLSSSRSCATDGHGEGIKAVKHEELCSDSVIVELGWMEKRIYSAKGKVHKAGRDRDTTQ